MPTISCPFRVLIIGRANAGKTSILQAVCGSNEEPKVYSPQGEDLFRPSILSPTAERGYHDVYDQLVFSSNPGFIFHDSRGFEAGSTEELEVVKTFISLRAGAKQLRDQIHAIWYCIPTDNIARLFTAAELQFFDVCNTGEVPVITIFTKFDSLDAQAFHFLRNTGMSRKEAKAKAQDYATQDFNKVHLPRILEKKFPPADTLCLRDMHKIEQKKSIQTAMWDLIMKTVDSLKSDISKQLLVSVQRTNVELCMKYAVERSSIFRIVQSVQQLGATVAFEQFKESLYLLLQWFPSQYNVGNQGTPEISAYCSLLHL